MVPHTTDYTWMVEGLREKEGEGRDKLVRFKGGGAEKVSRGGGRMEGQKELIERGLRNGGWS